MVPDPILEDGGTNTDAPPLTDGSPRIIPSVVLPHTSDGFCVTDRLCWQNPRPQGYGLNSIVTISPEDIWLFGEHGTALRYDRETLYPVETDSTKNLDSAWASGEGDIWVSSSDGELLHWNGRQFDRMTVRSGGYQRYHGISGTSANDVWILASWGSSSTRSTPAIVHWDGSDFRSLPLDDSIRDTRRLRGIFAISPTEAWAGGSHGALLRWDGIAWSLVDSPTESQISTIWGTSSDNLWLGTEDGLYRFDGVMWTRSEETAGLNVHAISGRDGEVVGLGHRVVEITDERGFSRSVRRYHSIRLTEEGWLEGAGQLTPFGDVAASARNDIWSTGPAGELHHFDGMRTTPVTRAVTTEHLRTVTESGGTTWAGGARGTLLRRVGSGNWQEVDLGELQWTILTILPRPDGRLWLFGDGGAVQGSPSEGWSPVPALNGTVIRDVHAIADDDVWAVGNSLTTFEPWAGHWNGETWTVHQVDAPDRVAGWELHAVWATSHDDVWIAGGYARSHRPFLTHFDGEAWRTHEFMRPRGPSTRIVHLIRGLWGSSANDIWAVGDFGTLIHFDGTNWNHLEGSPRGDLIAESRNIISITGSGEDDLWTVTEGGRVHRWDGVRFTAQTPDAGIRILNLLPASEVTLVGEDGAILRLSR